MCFSTTKQGTSPKSSCKNDNNKKKKDATQMVNTSMTSSSSLFTQAMMTYRVAKLVIHHSE
jgi:phosphoribosylformylglycinamidine (FGAM) synthase-like amidotransferase family enzyme